MIPSKSLFSRRNPNENISLHSWWDSVLLWGFGLKVREWLIAFRLRAQWRNPNCKSSASVFVSNDHRRQIDSYTFWQLPFRSPKQQFCSNCQTDTIPISSPQRRHKHIHTPHTRIVNEYLIEWEFHFIFIFFFVSFVLPSPCCVRILRTFHSTQINKSLENKVIRIGVTVNRTGRCTELGKEWNKFWFSRI